jgi:hypothetical protein
MMILIIHIHMHSYAQNCHANSGEDVTKVMLILLPHNAYNSYKRN